MNYNKDNLLAIVSVLKKRFNNLSASEMIELASQILEELQKVNKDA